MIGRRGIGALAGSALASGAFGARAQEASANWPDRPMRIVVPYAPGGTNDILARLYGQRLSERLGQPVVVENRAGAQGIVGTEAVARARPDGTTFLLGAMGPLVYNPATYDRLPYDAVRDLVPVCRMVVVPVVLVTGATSRHRDIGALMAAARAQGAGLTYGTSSAAFQLPMELLNQQAGTRVTFVAYRSVADAINAAANNEVDLAVVDTGGIAAALEGNRIRALALLSPRRDPLFPAIPTLAEAGLPALDADTFSGLFAPAGTPATILTRLGAACDAVSAEPETVARMRALGMVPSPAPPAEMARFIPERIAFWKDVAARAGIRLER